MLQNGTIIDGKYKILGKIGQGGMSTVYLAINERAGKQWAIKEVRRDAVADFRIVKQSLIAETNLLKRLSHKCLPAIVDIVDRDDSFLIVMDYVEGITLQQVLDERGPQREEDVIRWARQLCSVFTYLHSCNPPIIYRDLKPGNIMLKPDGDIVLIDFGTAREYKQSKEMDTTCLGTLGYAAPEQFGGHGQTDARTDIYNLGATLYHLITGHNPGKPPYRIYPIRHWNKALSQGLEKIISKCLMKDPQMRYRSAAEVMYDFEHYKELDRSYKIRAVMKLAAFATGVLWTGFLAAMTVNFHSLAHDMEKESYDEYLARAAEISESGDSFDEYKKAIYLDSDDGTAYVELLDNLILQDDDLTAQEDVQLREILLMTDINGKVCGEEFAKNQEDYEEFCYKLGLAYFYCYQDEGNKQLSARWLKMAGLAHTLPFSKKLRAERLYNISAYYSKIGNVSKSGDAAISYVAYWEDLCLSAAGDIVDTDNVTTALLVYNELANGVCNNAALFYREGIGADTMRDKLSEIESKVYSDIIYSGLQLSDLEQEHLQELQDALKMADKALDNLMKEEEKEIA